LTVLFELFRKVSLNEVVATKNVQLETKVMALETKVAALEAKNVQLETKVQHYVGFLSLALCCNNNPLK
jgi:hypothetical protein